MRPIVNITAVIGRNARPASSGLKPRTPCRNCVRKKNVENIPPTTSSRAISAPRRWRLANRCSGVIGCSARISVSTNAASRNAPAPNDATVQRSPQPSDAARTKPYTTAVMPSVEVTAPMRSKCPVRLGVSGRKRGASRITARPDGHVDEEAPAPGDPVGEHAAEHEADAAATAGDGAVVRDRARALVALAERRREQRERRGSGDRGAHALHGARAEQPRGGWRQAACERGGREERDAGDEHAAAAEDVTGARAQQQQAAERQRVGALHPREARGREVQRAVDLRQRGDDDRDVEHDHQVRGEDDREHGRGVRRALEHGADDGLVWSFDERGRHERRSHL